MALLRQADPRAVAALYPFGEHKGSGLGIIGPTGAGKSTLARAIVGAWPAMRGTVRLNGATMDQWDPAELGAYLGYLPQEVELFDGTIAENIARFSPDADSGAIVKAAQEASVHDLVLKMADGYNTQISEGGARLSAGQRQRIGLARALYGEPTLVVLDEPNSNLDAPGESASVGSRPQLDLDGVTLSVHVKQDGEVRYRVGRGDTLGAIAQRHLVRATRWPEILRLNQTRLANPATLKVGVELRLPADASRVRVVSEASERR